MVLIEHIGALRRIAAIAAKNARNKLHRYHLALFLRIRDTLMELASLIWQPLLVAVLLLLDQLIDELVARQFLGWIEVWLFSCSGLLARIRKEGTNRLRQANIEA